MSEDSNAMIDYRLDRCAFCGLHWDLPAEVVSAFKRIELPKVTLLPISRTRGLAHVPFGLLRCDVA